jgi:hypothetical protein
MLVSLVSSLYELNFLTSFSVLVLNSSLNKVSAQISSILCVQIIQLFICKITYKTIYCRLFQPCIRSVSRSLRFITLLSFCKTIPQNSTLILPWIETIKPGKKLLSLVLNVHKCSPGCKPRKTNCRIAWACLLRHTRLVLSFMDSVYQSWHHSTFDASNHCWLVWIIDRCRLLLSERVWPIVGLLLSSWLPLQHS